MTEPCTHPLLRYLTATLWQCVRCQATGSAPTGTSESAAQAECACRQCREEEA